MTEEIQDRMEERTKLKNILEERYRDMDTRIKQMCKDKKEEWLRAKCEEVKPLERMDSRLMAEKIIEMRQPGVR